MSPAVRQRATWALLLTTLAVGILGLTRGFPRIQERPVRVQLNALKLKWSDEARAQLNRTNSPNDIAGGFAWQNRLVTPLVLAAVQGAVRAVSPTAGLLPVQRFYAFYVAALLAAFFWLAPWSARRVLAALGEEARRLGSGRDAEKLAWRCTACLAVLLGIALLGPPETIFAADYLDLIVFALAVPWLLERRLAPLIPLAAVGSLNRESTLFLGPIFALLHWPTAGAGSGRCRVLGGAAALVAAAALVTFGTRALYLGGLPYAVGAGIPREAHEGVLARLGTVVHQQVWSLPSDVVALVLVAGCVPACAAGGRWVRRLCLAALFAVAASCVANFHETRIYYPSLMVAFVPCALGLLHLADRVRRGRGGTPRL
jgi:hypothetical protein